MEPWLLAGLASHRHGPFGLTEEGQQQQGDLTDDAYLQILSDQHNTWVSFVCLP